MKTTNQQVAQIMSVIFLFALTILFPGLIQPAFTQMPYDPPTAYSPQGTVTVEMKTDNGKVRVILPDDMRAGDTITGTVVDAQGVAEGEVITVKTVEGEVVATKRIDNSQGNNLLKFTVPAGLSNGQLSLGWAKGTHIPSAVLTINSTNFSGNIPTQLGSFAPPRIGQTGRPISIPGNFDGNASNTTVNIGGKELPVIAESPRKSVVQIPADCPTGSTGLTVKENQGNSQTSPFNVVSLKLSADKLNLMKGEKTNLHISITGLEGLKDNSGDIRLQIENASPQTVRLTNPLYQSNGNAGTMPTRAINPDGGNTITFTEQLIGVNPGNFVINASILDWIGKVIQEAMRVAANNKWRKQLNELADMKDSAANAIIGNSKAVKDLKENAAFLREKAGDDKYWDGKGGDDVDPKGLLEDEKKKLKHTKTSLSSSNGNAIGKIGAALDAIDKMLR